MTAPLFVLGPLLVAPLCPGLQEEAQTLVLDAALETATTSELEAALDTVRIARLESDLYFLADDQLGGRDTPSEGLTLAALFIRARLERLGFQPGGPRGFWYPYPLKRKGLYREDSGITLTGPSGEIALSFGEDYVLSRSSHLFHVEAAGPLVALGNGDRAAFEEVDMTGKWGLVSDLGGSTRRMQRRASEAGALGLVFVRADDEEKPYAKRYAAVTRVLNEPRITNPVFERKPTTPSLPLVMLTDQGAEALVAACPSGRELWDSLGSEILPRLEERRFLFEEEVEVVNVCGFWPGDDPVLSREVLIVSAHYDHVGQRNQDIFNGADDNASGTTGLLGVAEALAAHGPLDRSVLLLWLSGEEKGLWGSMVWTKEPWLPEGCIPVADINIDMIGRTDTDELYLTPTREHASFNSLSNLCYELAPLEGFPELASQDADWNRSDHFNFDRNLEIPVVFLSTGDHPDYHKPTDTAEKIDYDKMQRITRLVVRILEGAQDAELVR